MHQYEETIVLLFQTYVFKYPLIPYPNVLLRSAHRQLVFFCSYEHIYQLEFKDKYNICRSMIRS